MARRSPLSLCALVTVALCAACGGGSSGAAAPTTSAAPASPAAVTTSAPVSTAARSVAPTVASPSATAAPLEASCLSADDRPHVVHLAVSGETLEGLTLGSGTVGIVMVHQLAEDLCEWKPYAQRLAKLGYRVLIFTEGSDPPAAVVASAAELRHEGATRILLVGASIGGTTVLAAAALVKPAVAAVVDLSGPAELNGIDAASAVPHLKMPILFAAGSLDSGFVDDTHSMYKAAKQSVGRKLLIVNSGSHGVDLVTGKTQATIEAFLKKYASG